MAIDAVFPAASELVMLYGGALASGALTHSLDVFGSSKTGLGAFVAIGSAIWCFAWAGAGWGLGASWEGVHKSFAYVDYAVVAGIALLVAYIVLRRVRSITMARRASDTPR